MEHISSIIERCYERIVIKHKRKFSQKEEK